MYDELFAKVPDHPRLTRRESTTLTQRKIESKLQLISGFLNRAIVFAEFAPGDCRFASAAAERVKKIYAIDISNQSGLSAFPPNFELIIYDGYDLDLKDDSIDLVFSDQLIEHLYPEDAELHFHLVYRTLSKDGHYIFRTPHAFTGPHDISKYFSEEPEGFHLKEWTYSELSRLLRKTGFTRPYGYWWFRGRQFELPIIVFALIELPLTIFPRKMRKRIVMSKKFRFLRQGITIIASK